jgi:hypothetical protein
MFGCHAPVMVETPKNKKPRANDKEPIIVGRGFTITSGAFQTTTSWQVF